MIAMDNMLTNFGFTPRIDNQARSQRGMLMVYTKGSSYIEVYEQEKGLQIHLYGRKFNAKFIPLILSMTKKEDLGYLNHKLIEESEHE